MVTGSQTKENQQNPDGAHDLDYCRVGHVYPFCNEPALTFILKLNQQLLLRFPKGLVKPSRDLHNIIQAHCIIQYILEKI